MGDHGLQTAVLPGETACLRCLFPELPPAGSSETCETAGVLAPVTQIIGSLEAMDALKILSGNTDAIAREMIQIDLWNRNIVRLRTRSDPSCPCCAKRDFPFLNEARGTRAESLCGRNTVQIQPTRGAAWDLESAANRLAEQGLSCKQSRFWLRFEVDSLTCTAFPDGRVLVHGTEDVMQARSVYSRVLGD